MYNIFNICNIGQQTLNERKFVLNCEVIGKLIFRSEREKLLDKLFSLEEANRQKLKLN